MLLTSLDGHVVFGDEHSSSSGVPLAAYSEKHGGVLDWRPGKIEGHVQPFLSLSSSTLAPSHFLRMKNDMMSDERIHESWTCSLMAPTARTGGPASTSHAGTVCPSASCAQETRGDSFCGHHTRGKAPHHIRHACLILLCSLKYCSRAFVRLGQLGDKRLQRVTTSRRPRWPRQRARPTSSPHRSGYLRSLRLLAFWSTTPSVSAVVWGDPSQCKAHTSVVSNANCGPTKKWATHPRPHFQSAIVGGFWDRQIQIPDQRRWW